MMNLRCRGHDKRIVLHRGISSIRKENRRLIGSDEVLFDTDFKASNLLLFTHIQSDHFGTKEIIHWIESDDLQMIIMITSCSVSSNNLSDLRFNTSN